MVPNRASRPFSLFFVCSRQISLIDIEFEEVEIFPGVSAAEGHSPSSSLHRHWGNCSSNNNASSSRKSSAASSLNSLAGALDAGSRRARERSNSGLYKRHSFGTKGDRKSTSVDNFLAVTDYGGGGGGGTLRANRSSGGGLGHSQGKSASRGGGGGKSFGEAFAASLSFKQPLMALKKLRPGVAAAASAVVSGGGGGKKRGSSSVENFADLTALSQADGMPKKVRHFFPTKHFNVLTNSKCRTILLRRRTVLASGLPGTPLSQPSPRGSTGWGRRSRERID